MSARQSSPISRPTPARRSRKRSGWSNSAPGDPVYIAKRQVLHLGLAPGVFLAAIFGFWYLERKVSWWPSPRGWWAMVAPALVSLIVCEAREPWDVAQGSWVWKSYIDRAVWIFGLGFLGVFALYKLTPRLAEILEQIKEQKSGKRAT